MRIPPYIECPRWSKALDVAGKAMELLQRSGPTGFHINDRCDFENAIETEEMRSIKKRLVSTESTRTILILEARDSRQGMRLVVYEYDPKRGTHAESSRIRLKSTSDLANKISEHLDFLPRLEAMHQEDAPSYAVPFGYKIAWFAVKADKPIRVIAKAFDLIDLKEAEWSNGIEAAYAGKAFLTANVSGWVLIPTSALLKALGLDPANEFGSILRTASAALQSEVQLFISYRVAEFHLWARANKGRILRAFSYFGERMEVTWNAGRLTASESAIGLDDDGFTPSEESVMKIASSWSVDPTTLGHIAADPSGYVAEFKRSPVSAS